MHTLLGLTSLLLVVLAVTLTLGALRTVRAWPLRRDLQMLVLVAPVISLGLGIAGLYHFSGQVCWLGAPPWDYTLDIFLSLGMGVVALAALGWGVIRLFLMRRLVGRAGLPADTALQVRVDRLAAGVGAPPVRALVVVHAQPVALAHGFWRPTLLVSTWMLDHLDEYELEAALAHELAHAARRDYPATWLATVLRDAFCYLPTSLVVYAQLRRERELACDDLAVATTRRRLELASALARVWQQALTAPEAAIAAVAPALLGSVDAAGQIQARIERLLAADDDAARDDPDVASAAALRPAARSRALALGVGGSALGGLLAIEAANAAVLLVPMGCGLHATLVSLLGTLL